MSVVGCLCWSERCIRVTMAAKGRSISAVVYKARCQQAEKEADTCADQGAVSGADGYELSSLGGGISFARS